MQAIATKYIGPTNFRGSRVKASAEAGSVTVSWDHALSIEENHRAAAMALVAKYGWAGNWAGGVLPDGRHVYVCTDRTFGDGFVSVGEYGRAVKVSRKEIES